MAGTHRRAKNDPAADLFDRWMSSRNGPPGPAREPTPGPAPTTSAPPVTETAEPAGSPARHPAAVEADAATDIEFAPRTGGRRFVGWMVLLALAGLVVTAALAVQDPTTLTVGLAATLLVLTSTLWAIRAASPPARLAVHSGRLEVVQDGGRFVFELNGGYTPIEVIGAPGDRSWKVLFLRRNMAPFVVDASMVDPRAFMAMLRRYRPE